MRGKEIIPLDAVITNVINIRAFRARLKNGHEFTAYVPGDGLLQAEAVCVPGMGVRVSMSPFDMSCGEITEMLKIEAENES